jgi:serine/threonine protein kinase
LFVVKNYFLLNYWFSILSCFKYENYPSSNEKWVENIISKCLTVNPDERATANFLLDECMLFYYFIILLLYYFILIIFLLNYFNCSKKNRH